MIAAAGFSSFAVRTDGIAVTTVNGIVAMNIDAYTLRIFCTNRILRIGARRNDTFSVYTLLGVRTGGITATRCVSTAEIFARIWIDT